MDRTATFYSSPSYYARGGGFPVYAGSRRQRGGSMLGSLAKMALPVLGNIGKAVLGQVAGLTSDVADDVARGDTFRQSLKRRGISRLSRSAKTAAAALRHRPRRRRQALSTSRKRNSVKRTASRTASRKRAAPHRKLPPAKKAALF